MPINVKKTYQKLVLLSISGLLLLGCSRFEGINYLNQTCDPYPRLEAFTRPPLQEKLQGSACFLYQPTFYTAEEEKRLAATIYYALKQRAIFNPFIWGGIYRQENISKHCQKVDYLVFLEGAKILGPTQVAPGKIGLILRVEHFPSGKTVWHLSGALDLCPSYAKDLVVTTTRDQAPFKDLYSLQSQIYFLGRLFAAMLAS